jgi:hypothetical protein
MVFGGAAVFDLGVNISAKGATHGGSLSLLNILHLDVSYPQPV